MNRSFDTKLIISIAHDVVEEVEPDELRYFADISAAYAREPQRLLKQKRTKGPDLGFGDAVVAALVTHTVLIMAHDAVVQMRTDAATDAGNGAWAFLRRQGTKLFKRRSSNKQDNKPKSLEYTQKQIREKATETAHDFNISDAKTKQIVDALIGKLASIESEQGEI